MATFLNICAYGELFLWIWAFLLFFLQCGNSFAESFSYAIISTLMVFSFIFQVTFIAGFPSVSLFLEAILTIAAALVIWSLRSHFKHIRDILKFVTVRQPLAVFALSAAFGYLAYMACITVPEGGYPDLFTKLHGFEKHKTFFISDDSGENFALFPLNAAVLPYLFLRTGTQTGIGLFGFLSFISIGFSTYALSRRYAWPATAFTVTLIVLSMPRLVYLSGTPGQEILPAAVSLFCILAIYRALENPEIQDLILLILGILFSISGNYLCLAFPCILLVLSCVLFIRRHGTVTWTSLLVRHWRISLAAVIPILVFSQAWLFAFNAFTYGSWLGGSSPASSLPLKDNVLLGALANLVRYFFETIHLTMPLDMIFQWILGFSFNGFLLKIYNFFFVPLFGTSGAEVPFVLTAIPDGRYSWFGPFGVFFVIPSMIMAIFRGHRRLKAIGVALAGYVYLIALAVAWRPGNAEFFTTVFTCGGFCVSFLLPPWRFTTAGKKCLQVISILLLVYMCLFKVDAPIFNLSGFAEHLPSNQNMNQVKD